MKVHHLPFYKTGYFSNLINDYLDKNSKLLEFYENFPNIEGFKKQINLKSNFEAAKRKTLVKSLNKQYNSFKTSDLTTENIMLLGAENTFTVTTGHQLNIFTGPLYFLYKIVTTINLTKELKKQFPKYNFVPIYWMATEDHDFDEINYFNFQETKISWNKNVTGAVGRISTKGLDEVEEKFISLLNTSKNAQKLKELFNNSYSKHSTLAEATRYLVNELFGEYGLVIVDGDDKALKTEFKSILKDELIENTSYKTVLETNNKLSSNYKIQVNPREINLFYLKDNLRERIIFDTKNYIVNNTSISFTKDEILNELENYPERFSPNVIMRPLYQETVLPNLCYIGGGGELAYWFQLKKYFSVSKIPFPILLLRNSVLFISKKQLHKLRKLDISLEEIFVKQEDLISEKIKEISEIEIDFSQQKLFLKQQFTGLKELAKQTDVSFLGAVNAQEKKQLNGLDKLEQRLLKAQKRKLNDVIERITLLQNELFPNQSLEERTRNFAEYYVEFGDKLVPMLLSALNPLKLQFSIIEN
ncbi:bacillithiol biosynthesis cysteine-adding enzyme BshC [Lutibacter sp. B1]|uniref:bacillithiol biosynthesis cysteine-adding enzyme BshC n=1 Tax=Lutibacter sp. B1 TaxID=2725996 RepID=UPI0014572011|nr:bacillithiol biosynthesis cysteine-adding enzyme BshC [Lutibacter sp. B1]NLP56559.1 bacillithiol biosynthesis cysteine-adding enzyme BshC [Lutibacter sp. B1]